MCHYRRELVIIIIIKQNKNKWEGELTRGIKKGFLTVTRAQMVLVTIVFNGTICRVCGFSNNAQQMGN